MTGSNKDVAISDLLASSLPELRAFLRLRMGPLVRARESSGDLAQSVCRDILEHADRFRHHGEDGFKRWLYRTAVRKIADRHEYYLAAKRDVIREVPVPTEPHEQELLGCYQSLCTPSRHARAREELERVEAAFDSLSDQERDLILKARILGFSRAEIARQEGVSEGAVRTRLSRAMARLSELLTG